MSFVFFFFFFQAEDGIRDVAVTGVQTCALPISSGWPASSSASTCPCTAGSKSWRCCAATAQSWRRSRSEERRVGKECRSRWSPDHYKKNLVLAELGDAGLPQSKRLLFL